MKLLLTSLAGDHYIRYTSRKFKLFVRIEHFPAPEITQDKFDQLAAEYHQRGENFIGAITSLGGDHYLLHAIDHDLFDLKPERAAKTIAHQMRRLADWYKYAFLIPIAQGRNPKVHETQPTNPPFY